MTVSSQQAASGAVLTIFSIPKAFTGHAGIIQRNALLSWTMLAPRPRIILFGDETGISDVAQEMGLEHVPHVEVNEYGTPLISSIFEAAQRMADTTWVAYVNTDIILLGNFAAAAARLPAQLAPSLIVGRRHDLMVWDAMDFSPPNWEEKLVGKVKQEGILDASSGIDYFMFNRGLYADIPPFAVGRTCWDNWLIWRALQSGGRLIDATRRIMIIHQEHPYTHVKGGANEIWNGLEAQRNRDLAQGGLATIRNANYCLEAEGVLPWHAGYALPEPMMQDVNDLKYRESIGAYLRGEYETALDLLEYVKIWGKDGQLPEGYIPHMAKVLVALNRTEEAVALLEAQI